MLTLRIPRILVVALVLSASSRADSPKPVRYVLTLYGQSLLPEPDDGLAAAGRVLRRVNPGLTKAFVPINETLAPAGFSWNPRIAIFPPGAGLRNLMATSNQMPTGDLAVMSKKDFEQLIRAEFVVNAIPKDVKEKDPAKLVETRVFPQWTCPDGSPAVAVFHKGALDAKTVGLKLEGKSIPSPETMLAISVGVPGIIKTAADYYRAFSENPRVAATKGALGKDVDRIASAIGSVFSSHARTIQNTFGFLSPLSGKTPESPMQIEKQSH